MFFESLLVVWDLYYINESYEDFYDVDDFLQKFKAFILIELSWHSCSIFRFTPT